MFHGIAIPWHVFEMSQGQGLDPQGQGHSVLALRPDQGQGQGLTSLPNYTASCEANPTSN